MTDAHVTVDPSHINYEALTAPVPLADVRAYRARAQIDQATAFGPQANAFALTSVAVFFGAGIVVVSGGLIVTTIISSANAGGSIWDSGDLPLGVFFAVMLTIVVISVARWHFGASQQWSTWLRLAQFAKDNQLLFARLTVSPAYPGCIFVVGDERRADDHVISPSGRFFDMGGYSYATGSGRDRSIRHWTYLAIKLDHELPNMVLESKAGRDVFGATALPATFSRDQILPLEGDFDNYFTLYCPSEYQQDALYVFTPDLMALLIDKAAPFDVEIVQDWMFFYSPKQFRPLEPQSWQRLFTILQSVGSKAVVQADRYVDERAAVAGTVAPSGLRLRHRVSVGTIVAVAAFTIVAVVQIVGTHGL